MSHQEIVKDIQAIVSSKNPLSILFSLTKIREKVLELGDRLINSIESTFYDNTMKDFSKLLDEYKKSGFFGIIYAYYADSGYFSKQKAYLDSYFEESYYKDIDFYFYVLGKNRFFHACFSLLFYVTRDTAFRTRYWSETSVDAKLALLRGQYEEFGTFLMDREKVQEILHFLDTFIDFPFEQYHCTEGTGQKGKWGITRFMRNLFISSVRNRGASEKYVLYFQEHFIENPIVKKKILDGYSTGDIIDLFLFLRSKLLDAPKFNINLTKKNDYRTLIERAHAIRKGSIQEKYGYILEVEQVINCNPVYREAFYNVLRKGMMYDNSLDLIDALFGVHFLPREAFYEVRKKTREIDARYSFPALDGVKMLASLFEESFVMKLIRPFIIQRLAKIFNKRNDVYYFVKFILTLHACENYKEYKNVSKFFMALEAHGKTGLYGQLLRAMQFGWIYILFLLLYFIAPLGVFVACISILGFYYIGKAIEKQYPEISLNANFQFSTYIGLLGIAAFLVGTTFGLKDNTHIVYNNFRSVINAFSLITSESVELIGREVTLKSSIWESNTVQSWSILREIDYLNGRHYRDLRD